MGLRLCREAGDRHALALGLLFLGILTTSEHDGARAATALEERLRLFRDDGEEWGASFALIHSGILPLRRDDHASAARRFDEGLAAARVAGDRVAIHQALYNLGLLAQARGDADQAATHFASGLALAAEPRDRWNAGYFIKGLAEVAAGRGRPIEGARLLWAAEAALEVAGSPLRRYVLEQPWHDRAVAVVRGELGEAAYHQARAEGRSLPLEAAIPLALELA